MGGTSCVIPNREVREVFVRQIHEWFKERVASDAKPMRALHQAFLKGDAEGVAAGLTAIMGKMISVLDTKARDAQKENFYHGLLLGLLRSEPDVADPVERGIGRRVQRHPDRATKNPDAGIVVEVKYAPTFQGLGRSVRKSAWSRSRRGRYGERLRRRRPGGHLGLRHRL